MNVKRSGDVRQTAETVQNVLSDVTQANLEGRVEMLDAVCRYLRDVLSVPGYADQVFEKFRVTPDRERERRRSGRARRTRDHRRYPEARVADQVRLLLCRDWRPHGEGGWERLLLAGLRPFGRVLRTRALHHLGPDSGEAVTAEETDRERIKKLWDRMQEFISDFLRAAQEQGQPWKEPHISLDDECLCSAEWFGNGPQGSEPARMLATFDDDNETPVALVCARETTPDFSTDGLATYLLYLKMNGWLISTSAKPDE